MKARVAVLLSLLLHQVHFSRSVLVIDISPLWGNDDAVAARSNATLFIDRALQEEGIFLAVGHGISGAQRHRSFASAEALFELDEASKGGENLLHNFRGFIPYAGESGLTQTVFEPKEGFSYGFDWRGSDPPSVMHAANSFPNSLKVEDVSQLDWLREQAAEVAKRITSAINTLPENADALRGRVSEGGEEISLMRIFNYFPLSSAKTQASLTNTAADVQVLGSAQHTDWGFITVIMENADGLQYLKNGSWIDVGHNPEALVINCGDYLSLVSQHRYLSPVHRVLSPLIDHRLSFVYFAYPGAQSTFPDTNTKREEAVVGAEGGYNTLLNLGQTEGESFADLIARKWRGVYKL